MALARLKTWLHRWRRPLRYHYLAELLRNQRLSRAALRRRHEESLAAIIRFARENVPYYAEAYAGLPLTPSLADLPVLDKNTIRRRLPDFLARGRDPAATPVGHTGGSTGEPLSFYYDEEKHERMRAGMMRSFMLSGWRPGEKIIYLWGARIDTQRGGVFASHWLDDWLAAEKTLPASQIDTERLSAWVTCLQHERPRLLYGYASVIDALARHMLARRIAPPASLCGVYCTAETLTQPMRERIETAFAAKVFDQYGCREIPNIACECRLGNLHVFTDLVAVESLAGRLLVTSLTNRLMPMIRYEIGDCGELLDAACPCGLPFPLMKMEIARANDFLVTPTGQRLHPSFLNRLLYGYDEIAQYQFVQERVDEVLLRLVASRPVAESSVAAWRARLAAQGLTLRLEYVSEIPRTNAGKHRFVICRLP